MKPKSTGWKFETSDGKSGFEFKAKGGKKAITNLNRIMNEVEADMKRGEADEQT